MGRDAGAMIMLVIISAIVLATLVLWQVEKIKRWRAVRSAFLDADASDDAGVDESEVDPYGVGMNDKDIL